MWPNCFPGEIRQLVGVAIPAGQRVAQQRRGKIARRLRRRWRGGRDYPAARKPLTMASCRKQLVPGASVTRQTRVSVAVGEFLGRKVIAQRQRLEEHGVVAVGTKLQVEEQRSRAGDFVDEAATHAHGDIEVRRNVRQLHAGSHGTTLRSPTPWGSLRHESVDWIERRTATASVPRRAILCGR